MKTKQKSNIKKEKKNKMLTLKEKMDIVKFMDTSGKELSIREMAKKLNIGKSNLHLIKCNKELIRTRWLSGFNENSKRINNTHSSELDQLCIEWYRQKVKRSNAPITGQMVREKAKEIAKQIGRINFQASPGWLVGWLRRQQLQLGFQHDTFGLSIEETHKNDKDEENNDKGASDHDEDEDDIISTNSSTVRNDDHQHKNKSEKDEKDNDVDADETNQPAKKHNRVVTLKEKMEVIKFIDSCRKKWTLSKLAQKFKFSKSLIHKIKAQKDLIRSQWLAELNKSTKYTKKKLVRKRPELDRLVIEWYWKEVKRTKVKITSKMVREKALEFAKQIGLKNFKASLAWFNRWKRRQKRKIGIRKDTSGLPVLQIHPNTIHNREDTNNNQEDTNDSQKDTNHNQEDTNDSQKDTNHNQEDRNGYDEDTCLVFCDENDFITPDSPTAMNEDHQNGNESIQYEINVDPKIVIKIEKETVSECTMFSNYQPMKRISSYEEAFETIEALEDFASNDATAILYIRQLEAHLRQQLETRLGK